MGGTYSEVFQKQRQEQFAAQKQKQSEVMTQSMKDTFAMRQQGQSLSLARDDGFHVIVDKERNQEEEDANARRLQSIHESAPPAPPELDHQTGSQPAQCPSVGQTTRLQVFDAQHCQPRG